MRTITTIVTIRTITLAQDRAPIDELVVPVDGSAESERALPVAESLASVLDARLRLLTTLTEAGDRSPTAYLDDLAASLPLRVTTDVALDQEPVAAITSAAEASRVGVCMATHARGRLLATLHPSVAEAVIEGAVGPVFLVGPNCVAGPLGDGPVLVAHDGTPESTAAGRRCLAVVAALGRPIEVVAVVSAPSGKVDEPYPDEVREMRELCRSAELLGLVANHQLVFANRVGAGLAQAIGASQPALIVMSTHHRDRLERLREGSVTMGVVHDATVPVLVGAADDR